MAKRNYEVKAGSEAEADAGNKTLALAKQISSVPVSQYVAKGVAENITSDLFGSFEDKSLPPIVGAKSVKPGDIIMGEIDTYGEYNDDKGQINTALLTVHVLDYNPAKKELFRVGARIALPVSAVLARALGAPAMKKDVTPQQQIDAIKANGYLPGTQIIMQYTGQGKARNKQNAPHLWNIKVKKPTGEVQDNRKK